VTSAHRTVDPDPRLQPRVGVLVVAFNAASTVAATLARLPQSFIDNVDHILVCDDASSDDTYQVAADFKSKSTWPLTVVRHETNLGYGGNQKAGYEWAIQHGLDIVVLLHGDGQYAPEIIEDLTGPLLDGDADAVFGSRMLIRGAARQGGMPLYKYTGNRILTEFQNKLTGLDLSEWHSGYRAYRVSALAELPLSSYTDDFDFDTEIILGLASAGKRIVEVPIPTYYGDEICYVNGMRYAKDVTVDVVRHWARRRGFGGGTGDQSPDDYRLKPQEGSHRVLLDWLAAKPASSVLDVGCFDGRFAAHVRRLGHRVVGVDRVEHPGVRSAVSEFHAADLNEPLPSELHTSFDVIVAADVHEHVAEPNELLGALRDRLSGDGEILVSIPSISHWYPRGRIMAGRFDYDQRGPLDRGHLRFFTRRTMERMFAECGLSIVEWQPVGAPIESMTARPSRLVRSAAAVDRRLSRAWPNMFGYQHLYRLKRP
jgi:2-polyprenyl-3-methyl-5-hydroxy-6-metoxy-1,4-benzoquinol methylase